MALKSKCGIFLFLFVEIMIYLFVYDTNTLEAVSNATKFETQVEYFKCVFIIIILFSKKGVKKRLKGIFLT